MKLAGTRVVAWRRRECFRLTDGGGKRGINDDILV